MKNSRLTLAMITAALLLTGCSAAETGSTVSESIPAAVTAEAPAEPTAEALAETNEEVPAEDGSIYVDFEEGDSPLFECSDGWSNGSMFNCTWRKGNVSIADGIMTLKIDNDITPALVPYSGGEYRSKDFYGYGMYEVSMKAIKNDGVVSSFFTYTGPSDNNPWDEIDIEFLGKDTTKVQFNYFTDSKGNHEYLYDLGFDASEDFHTYGFEWKADSITWYVDGEAVYAADANIPSVPGKIMMNTWPGTGVDGWLKAFDDSALPISAEYDWIRFTPAEE
ncbi:MAG: glycoside hydrolase family 16 protein [Oscillospiraceae bacterium]